MDNLSNNKRIAKNSVFLTIRMIIVLGISLFTTRFILQALGIVDYGIYNVVCGFVVMFGFLNISMSNGIQRFYNYEYGKNGESGANRVYCTAILIQIALAVLILIILEPIGIWYIHNKMNIPADRSFAAEWIFQFSVLMFLSGILQAPYSAAVIAHEKFDFYAVISVSETILKFICAYAIIKAKTDRLILYGALMAIVSILITLLYILFCKKKFDEIYFKASFDKTLFKSMLGFSGWNLMGSFSNVMSDQGINLVLNFFFGPVVNAARGVAHQINGAVQSFVMNISLPVRPQVTQSFARGDIKRTMTLTYSVSKITCGIVLILAIPASIEMDYLLHLWLGSNVPKHTISFTIIILLGSLVTNLNWATSGVVHATGNMRDYQVLGSALRLCAVPISFILLRYYKIPEIALLTVVVFQILAHIFGLFIVRKLVGMSIRNYMVNVVFPIFAIMFFSIVVIYGVHMLIPSGFVRLIAVSFSSLLVVCPLFYCLSFNKSEKEFVNKLITVVLIRLNIIKK